MSLFTLRRTSVRPMTHVGAFASVLLLSIAAPARAQDPQTTPPPTPPLRRRRHRNRCRRHRRLELELGNTPAATPSPAASSRTTRVAKTKSHLRSHPELHERRGIDGKDQADHERRVVQDGRDGFVRSDGVRSSGSSPASARPRTSRRHRQDVVGYASASAWHSRTTPCAAWSPRG